MNRNNEIKNAYCSLGKEATFYDGMITCSAARYGLFRIPLAIVGIVQILLGVWMWYSAVFCAKVDEHITGNPLAAKGLKRH